MQHLRFTFAGLLLCAALPASAVTNSFNFTPEIGHTGINTWDNSAAAKYGVNGTNYGNTRTYAGSLGSTSVTVSAWGSTGGIGGLGGTLQSGYVGVYGANDLGVTSRPISGNLELDVNNNPNTGNSQHAMDNNGAYESLLFAFQSSVTLNDVSIGFPAQGSGLDSDATVLVYNGAGDPTAGLTARTYADLLTNGWSIAGNLNDLVPGTPGLLSTTASSRFWMVGAFLNVGSNIGKDDGHPDYIKINGLTTTPSSNKVPEPSTLALFGIAAAALVARRRKAQRAAE